MTDKLESIPTHADVGCVSGAFLRFPVPVAAELLKRMASGEGHRKLSVYLNSQGIKVSERMVAYLVAEEKSARAPLAREIAKERLEPEISATIDKLREIGDDLAIKKLEHKAKRDHKMFLAFVKAEHDNAALLAKFQGLGEGNQREDTASGALKLSQKLADLAAKLADIPKSKDDDIIDVEVIEDETEC